MGGATKNVQEEVKKPTYEELKNYCNQLFMQRNQLAEKLDAITNVVNKLPWLFEVIKASNVFDPEFVGKCVKEIEEILSPEEPKEEEEKDKE